MKTLKLIGVDKLQSFEIPEAARTLDGNTCAKVLENVYDEWSKNHNVIDNYFPLRELIDMSWVWQDIKNKTLPQRIDKIMRQHNVKLETGFLGEIGNEIRESIPAADTYIFDITQNFNWIPGTFGIDEKDSCMWQGRSKVKDEMAKDGRFYALRFFTTEMSNANAPVGTYANTRMREPVTRNKANQVLYGLARCWVYNGSVIINKRKRVSAIIIFNDYGDLPLRTMASVFATILSGGFKQIKISNKKKAHGGLYTNGPGYVITEPDVVDVINHMDFGLENSYDKAMRIRSSDENPFRRNSIKINSKLLFRRKHRNKKKRNRLRRRIANLRHMQSVHWRTADMTHSLIYNSDRFYKNSEIVHPSTVRYYWQIWQYRLKNDFWRTLVKLIQQASQEVK